MLGPLASLIAEAARESQIWVVTHSETLAAEITARTAAQAWRVLREDGATRVDPAR